MCTHIVFHSFRLKVDVLCSLAVTLHIVFRLAFSLEKVTFCILVELEPNNDMLFSREIQKAV